MPTHKGQDYTAYLEMDIGDLKKAITDARKEIASINSVFTEAAGKGNKWEHSVDNLVKKILQLNDLIGENKKMTEIYSTLIQKLGEKYSTNERRAEKLTERLRYLKEAGQENTKEYEITARQLDVCNNNMLEAKVATDKYTTTLSNTKGEVVTLTRDMNDYEKEVNEVIKADDRANSALGTLEQTISDQEKELEELKDKYKNVVLEQGEMSEEADKLASDIDDLCKNLKENKDTLKEVEDAADDTTTALNDTDDATDKAGDGFTVLKGVVVRFVTEALHKAVDKLREFVDTAIEFESSFADVRKVLGDVSDEELADLEQGIRDLALVRPQTASDIAEISAMAAQLGVRGTDNILNFTDTMVKLSDATNLTGEEAASNFAQFMNIMTTSQEDVDKLGATVVNLGNNFATTERDIIEMSLRLGAAGKLAGMTEADVLGVATALSSVGIRADAGGSAFSKLIINMSNASANGQKANEIISQTGYTLRDLQMMADNDSASFKSLANELGYTSDEFQGFVDASATLEGFSEVTGLTADEFTKKFGEDATGTVQQFINSLADMSDTEALQTLNEMGIKEIRLRDTILRSTTGIENFNKALDIANEGWEENIALDNEANQRYQTTESRMKMVKNRFNEFGIKMKNKFQPAIDKLIDAMGWIADNAEPISDALLVIVSAIAGFLIVDKVIPALKAFKLALMADPTALMVGGIFALVAAFVILWNKCEWFREFWINLWEGIKTLFKGTVDTLVNWFSTAIDWIVDIFEGIPSWFGDRFNEIKEFGHDLWDSLVNGFRDALGLIKAIFSAIGEWFGDRWQDVKDALGAVGTWFKEKFEEAKENVHSAFSSIGSWFGDRWSDIKGVFGDIGRWFYRKFANASGRIKEAFSSIGLFFTGIWGKIKGAFDSVVEFFKGVFEEAAEAIKKVWQGVVDFFDWVWDRISWIFGGGVSKQIKKWGDEISASQGGGKAPQMATGGVLKKGQVGILEGDGAEAVVPLDQNKRWIRKVASDMVRELTGGSGDGMSSITNGGKTVNFTQIINAPKQPSRIELYRQTRNLLNFSQEGV